MNKSPCKTIHIDAAGVAYQRSDVVRVFHEPNVEPGGPFVWDTLYKPTPESLDASVAACKKSHPRHRVWTR